MVKDPFDDADTLHDDASGERFATGRTAHITTTAFRARQARSAAIRELTQELERPPTQEEIELCLGDGVVHDHTLIHHVEGTYGRMEGTNEEAFTTRRAERGPTMRRY